MRIICKSVASRSQIYNVSAYNGVSCIFGDGNDPAAVSAIIIAFPSVSAPLMMSSACGSCEAPLSGCRKSTMTSATWLVDEGSITHNGVACIRAPIETFDEIGRQYCWVARCILGSDACDKSRLKVIEM